jgi:putative DNA primase/helicase
MTTNNYNTKSNNYYWLEESLPYAIRWSGSEGRTNCPLHDDKHPSFSVNYEEGVWYCHAGCGGGKIEDLAQRLGVSAPLSLDVNITAKENTNMKMKNLSHEISYYYHDENENPLFLIGRDGSGDNKRFTMYHRNDGDWYLGKGGVPNVPYRLPSVLQGIANNKPIFIVEGEKDAHTLGVLGFTATTSRGGANNWPMSDERFLNYFSNADIVILPDNDKPGMKYAHQVAHSLHNKAKKIRTIELPGLPTKGDVTDWFNNGHTTEEFNALVEKTPYWAPNDNILEFIKGGKIALDVQQKYFDGGSFSPPLLGKEIVQELPCFYDGKVLYAYSQGVYKPNGKQMVRQLCQKKLGTQSRKTRIEEVIYYLETEALTDQQDVNFDDGLINVKNGLLNWKTGELHPHTADRLSTIQLPVVFDPTAQCPEINKFLGAVLPNDAVPTVLEFFGYCLIPSTKYEKSLMLTGRGANGKSTMLKLLVSLLGRENTTSIPLQELADSRWKRADLKGKLLNSFADISHQSLENSSLFKAIISGDEIDAERKGKDPFYFRPYSKMIFSANEIPGSKDASKAFFRRWIVVPFPNSFEHGKDADPDLLDKLITSSELSGLLNLAISGLTLLSDNNCFTENETTKVALEQYKADVDSVLGFVEEACVIDPEKKCIKKVLFQAYKTWCEEWGLKSLGRTIFYRRLSEHYPFLKDGRATNQSPHCEGIGLK